MQDMVPDWILDKKTSIHGMMSEIYHVYRVDNSTISSLLPDFEICTEVCKM